MSDESGLERYSRQVRLPEVGRQGQRRLGQSRVLLVGCGALGSVLANSLVRAGVGELTVVDRDLLELHNLQRQVLYDEQDVAAGLPKAEAAARRLRRVNSTVSVSALVQDVTAHNVEGLVAGAHLVLDGTDNLETRYVINDACVKAGTPWIYGGVIGTNGMTMNVLPGGPCLRCVFPTPPPAGSLPTCETAGVLGTAPAVIASLQATEAIKILCGAETPASGLLSVDLWGRRFQQVEVLRDEACPTCGRGQYDFLKTRETAWVTSLCGRDAVQITPARPAEIDLEQLARTLESAGEVSFNGFLLQAEIEGHELVIFPDGRVMIKGTTDEAVARSLYNKYVGG